jgi:hercynylcysteine S-oxide lyase
VRDAIRHFQDLSESTPDKFFRYDYADYLLASRQAVANLFSVHLDTVVLIQNASLGVNTALRNLVYEPGDVIVYFDTVYGACEKTIASILETTPQLQARKVDGYEFPCEFDEIVGSFLETVKAIRDEGLKPKVALFDTICSLPGVRFPFERITEECRKHGILSCIDAAHGIGQIPLDLGTLDPDFLVSNCHK